MKETISKVKRQPSEWDKIIATDKELISKIYKQLIQLNTRKKKQTQSKSGRKTGTKGERENSSGLCPLEQISGRSGI